MRIVIAGPPKTGNVWLKCLLGAAFDLRVIGPKDAPPLPTLDSFRAWVDAGNFTDGAVFHQHFDYSDTLADAIEAVPAHIVTIIRDPYDTFVSSYFTHQQHLDADPSSRRKGRPSDLLMGKPLDHPDVLAYLDRGGFRPHLKKGQGWLESGRGQVVRYEDLHRDPHGSLGRLAAALGPVDPDRLAAAIETCSAENMRKHKHTAKHVRAAKVGDSKQRLTEDHLAIFRVRHADLIEALGYEVR